MRRIAECIGVYVRVHVTLRYAHVRDSEIGTGLRQSFAAALEGRDGPAGALLLVKAGQGMKDAFLLHGGDAGGAPSSQAAECGVLPVAWEALEPALAAALADGFAAGRPPAGAG